MFRWAMWPKGLLFTYIYRPLLNCKLLDKADHALYNLLYSSLAWLVPWHCTLYNNLKVIKQILGNYFIIMMKRRNYFLNNNFESMLLIHKNRRGLIDVERISDNRARVNLHLIKEKLFSQFWLTRIHLI